MNVGARTNQPILLVVQPMEAGGVMVMARDISTAKIEAESLEHKAFMASVRTVHLTRFTLWTPPAESPDERTRRADQLLMLAGRNFSEFVAAEPVIVIERFQHTLSGQETQFEVRAIRVDGTVRHVELQSSPLGEMAMLTVSWSFCAM